MAHSCRTRCSSKVSPVRLVGDWSKISMGTDWVEKSTKQDGPFSGWLVKSKRPSSVLTDKRPCAEQSSESQRICNRRSSTVWKLRKLRRNDFWDCPMRVSAPIPDISRRTPSFCRPRTIRSGTEQNWRPSEPKGKDLRQEEMITHPNMPTILNL